MLWRYKIRAARSQRLYHPEYRIIKSLTHDGLSKTLTPIYPVTEGLQQSRLKAIISHAVDLINDAQPLEDFLPEKLSAALGFADVTGAIRQIHRPRPSSLAADENKDSDRRTQATCVRGATRTQDEYASVKE